MKLWHCNGARSLRPLWALEEMGLDYEVEVLPFPPRIFQREYLDVNRLGTVPFFVDGEPSEQTQKMMDFCTNYELERKRTVEFCKRLKELELLSGQEITYTPEGEEEPSPLVRYVSVNAEKLNDLATDAVVELHKSGRLASIYLQLYSLDNWQNLLARREHKKRQSA